MGKAARGISTVEWATLLAIVVAAMVGMRLYVKRAVEGHVRSAADSLGSSFYYAPGSTVSHDRLTSSVTSREAVLLEEDVFPNRTTLVVSSTDPAVDPADLMNPPVTLSTKPAPERNTQAGTATVHDNLKASIFSR